MASATTAAALTSTMTSAVGTAATAAAAGTAGAQLRAGASAKDQAAPEQLAPTPASTQPQPPLAWDAYLDSPPGVDAEAERQLQQGRRAALGLCVPAVEDFVNGEDGCEFVSLGCFCATSHALQLLGLKLYSYPFDWVRSSLGGVIHCLDSHFEDFLTYSTYMLQGQFVVFGGTRWGGSFWHHNLEVSRTRSDMLRRTERFYGRGSVSACRPRFFVRVVNSTRELEDATKLREALLRALPQASAIYLLLIVDLQAADAAWAVGGSLGQGILAYTISEAETMRCMSSGASDSFRLCSESYTKAIAFTTRYFVGETESQEVRTFSSFRALDAACVQFDGGDPGRELFTPRKFYGQLFSKESHEMLLLEGLLARLRVQLFFLSGEIDTSAPWHLEVFGKSLRITLPPETSSGCSLQVTSNDGVLSAVVVANFFGQMQEVAPALIEELSL